MKILVVGGNGMLGHSFLMGLRARHQVKATLRGSESDYCDNNLLNSENSFFNVDVTEKNSVLAAFEQFGPEAVINATGVTKQLVDGRFPERSIAVNAMAPHQLAELCKEQSARLVQLSSDCVFSGAKGNYCETDVSDATDLYGRTKYLGEIDQPHVITLRKSTIGLELDGKHGLVEWFLAQTGEIKGYKNAIFSGLFSAELVRVVEMILENYKSLSGIWNIAGNPTNKYDLLVSLQKLINLKGVAIAPDTSFQCDRSLDGSKFEIATGYKAPSWQDMLEELAEEILSR